MNEKLMKEKRAIIVVSFGTTYIDALKACIEPIEREIAGAFDSYTVYRAFTSVFVRKRLAEYGIVADGLPEVLETLKQDGYTDVIILPTHIIEGEEYRNKVASVAEGYRSQFARLVVGRPLLSCCDEKNCSIDHRDIAEALRSQFPPLGEDEIIVLMGHGSKCAQGSVYSCLQEAFDACGLRVVIGVMEEGDALSFAYVAKRIQGNGDIKKVCLVPFLLVAGCHVEKDMTGDGSWQIQLQEAGYQVRSYLHGLGENEAVRALYVKRVRDMISSE
ncbi:MAG: sirohydrochlorin cobaltochelatase [Selenomonadales bacterium]|nr:sirohydrochlorin cobaltochelatase [Selenomonadales bacterium]